jgi:hypothetical protein
MPALILAAHAAYGEALNGVVMYRKISEIRENSQRNHIGYMSHYATTTYYDK